MGTIAFRCIFLCMLSSYCGIMAEMTDDQIMNYLMKFHYAGPENPSPRVADLVNTDMGMAMRVGCMMFQQRYNLTMTGDCRSEETARLMETPRCGNSDINSMEDMMSMDGMFSMDQKKRRRRYALQGSRWPKLDLTYKIFRHSTDLSQSAVDTDVALAFKVWSDVTPLTFTRVESNPDIEIAFMPRIHGDESPFDGESGTLAHAFFPQFGGDAHFDEAELWTVNTVSGINVFQVAAHEFGHALGLAHSENTSALMAPFYGGYIPVDQFQLSTDDILGIQALYGAPGMTMAMGSPEQGGRAAPQIPDGAPNVCDDASFNAILSHVVDGQLKTFAFIGEYYMEIDDTGLVQGFPRLISEDWGGLTQVDAALMFDRGYTQQQGVYNRDTYTFIFQGSQYYLFTNMVMESGYPRSIEDYWGLPSDLDAAFQWSGNGLTYFIKGDQYYRFTSLLQVQPDAGYPRPLSIWSEDFTRIGAVFQFANRRTYFFEGDKYYRFNDSAFAIDDGYPKSTGEVWLGCSTDLNEGRGDSSNAPQFPLTPVNILLSLFAALSEFIIF